MKRGLYTVKYKNSGGTTVNKKVVADSMEAVATAYSKVSVLSIVYEGRVAVLKEEN